MPTASMPGSDSRRDFKRLWNATWSSTLGYLVVRRFTLVEITFAVSTPISARKR